MPPAPKVALTAAALDDFARLDTFLRRHSPRAADRFQDVMDAALERLPANPRLGRPASRSGSGELRELVVGFGRSAYIIRYEVQPGTLVIARVHHAKEDR